MKIGKTDKKIKNWYKLTETKISSIFLQVFLSMIRIAGLMVAPVFAAKVTVALVAGNYNNAWLYLTIELGIILLSLLANDLVFRNGARMFTKTYNKVQSKIYMKAYRAKKSNFEQTSKEKLLNIIGTDVDAVASFGDEFGVKISKAIQIIVTLVIVFSINYLVGIAILLVSVINFIILTILNKSLAEHKAKLLDEKDKIYEKFTLILSNQDMINQYDIGKDEANDYFKRCEEYTEISKEHKITDSVKENYFVGFYKVLLFAITCLMIFLVKDNKLSLEVYLIIVPYLLTSVELINDIINISSLTEDTNVSVQRINTILNFTDDDFIAYGNVHQAVDSADLYLVNVSYKNEDEKSENFGTIKRANMDFKSGKINLIKGESGCGKRAIFRLIARKIKPDKGVVLLNDISLYDYDKPTYKSYVFNAYGKPRFIEGSILDNMSVFGATKEEIAKMCKELEVDEYIESLPEKYNTNIFSPNIDPAYFFIFELVMGMLKQSKIISIYECPMELNKRQTQKIKKTIEIIAKTHTVLLFTQHDNFDDIASMIYRIENGEICERVEKETTWLKIK